MVKHGTKTQTTHETFQQTDGGVSHTKHKPTKPNITDYSIVASRKNVFDAYTNTFQKTKTENTENRYSPGMVLEMKWIERDIVELNWGLKHIGRRRWGVYI